MKIKALFTSLALLAVSCAFALPSVSYIDADGVPQTITSYSAVDADASSIVHWSTGTYVVGKDYNGDGKIDAADALVAGAQTTFTYDTYAVVGQSSTEVVKIIVADGFELAMKNAFTISCDSTVEFFGQKEGTGRFVSNSMVYMNTCGINVPYSFYSSNLNCKLHIYGANVYGYGGMSIGSYPGKAGAEKFKEIIVGNGSLTLIGGVPGTSAYGNGAAITNVEKVVVSTMLDVNIGADTNTMEAISFATGENIAAKLNKRALIISTRPGKTVVTVDGLGQLEEEAIEPIKNLIRLHSVTNMGAVVAATNIAESSSVTNMGAVSFVTNNYVSLQGAQTITGAKNFTGGLMVKDSTATLTGIDVRQHYSMNDSRTQYADGKIIMTKDDGMGGAKTTTVDIPSDFFNNITGTMALTNDIKWGKIAGTLEDQTDLSSALGSKANKADIKNYVESYYHVSPWAGASFLWYPDSEGDYNYDAASGDYVFENNGKRYTITEINAATSMLRCVYAPYDDKIYFDRSGPYPKYITGSGFNGTFTYHKVGFQKELVFTTADEGKVLGVTNNALGWVDGGSKVIALIEAETNRAITAESDLEQLWEDEADLRLQADNDLWTAHEVETNRSYQADVALYNIATNKQDKLPTKVNDKYLHVNAVSGNLEWADAGGSASGNVENGGKNLQKEAPAVYDTRDLLRVDAVNNGYQVGHYKATLSAAESPTGVSQLGFYKVTDLGDGDAFIEATMKNGLTYFSSRTSGIWSLWTCPNKQTALDVAHPVNSIWIQYTNDDSPSVLFNGNGVASTWTDVTANYASRFFKADPNLAVGTLESESLPKPSIVTAGAHTHAPGTLDIVSSCFGYARKNAIYDRYRTGAFTFTKGGDSSATYQDTELDGKNSSYVYNVNLKLAGNWNTATATASSGGHTHTVNTSGPYGDNYSVKPLTSTVKIWKRTN